MSESPRNLGGVLTLVLACLGCSGRSESTPSFPDDAGLAIAGGSGTSNSDGGQAAAGGVLTSANDGGGTSAKPESPGGAAGAEAGAPHYVPHIDSATRPCEDANYCFGLSCYAPPAFAPTVCVSRCDTDADCAPFETCVRSAKLEATCYARCDTPRDCAYRFDCFDFSGQGPLVCFPSAWAARRDELAN